MLSKRYQIDFTCIEKTNGDFNKFSKELVKAAKRLGKKHGVSVAYGEDSFMVDENNIPITRAY